MDRKAVASFFKTSRHLVKRRILAGGAALLILFPTFLTHFFFWRVEHRLNLKIYRKPFFVLYPGLIRLEGAFLEWPNHLRIKSGSLVIRYPAVGVFLSQFSISFNGQNLSVEPGPELQAALGRNEVVFDSVRAKILVSSSSGVDVEFLDAQSKTIQFHLTKQS